MKLMKSDWTHRPRGEDQEQQAERQREDPRRPPFADAVAADGRPAPRGDGPVGRRRLRRGPGSPRWSVAMISCPVPIDVGLLLHGLQGGSRVGALLGDLLHLGVEAGDDLLPRRERRRGLGGLELLAEDGELRVGGEGRVLPRATCTAGGRSTTGTT